MSFVIVIVIIISGSDGSTARLAVSQRFGSDLCSQLSSWDRGKCLTFVRLFFTIFYPVSYIFYKHFFQLPLFLSLAASRSLWFFAIIKKYF